MFNPAILWIELAEFLLRLGNAMSVSVENHRARTGCALVYGEDMRSFHGGLLSSEGFIPEFHNSSIAKINKVRNVHFRKKLLIFWRPLG
jgi:hypothetical protein